MNSFSISSLPLEKENSGQMVSFLLSLVSLCRMAAKGCGLGVTGMWDGAGMQQ